MNSLQVVVRASGTAAKPKIAKCAHPNNAACKYTCRFAGNFFCRRHRQNIYPLPAANLKKQK